jgi:Flp pilus assembly protein TadG
MSRSLTRTFYCNERGVAAVEFAMVSPVFITMFLGIICFTQLYGTYNAVQQLAAEAARAGVGGINSSEQTQLAQAYVSGAVASYPFLDASKTTVTTSSQATTFQVTVTYNLAGSMVIPMGSMFGAIPSTISRSASIQNSGF